MRNFIVKNVGLIPHYNKIRSNDTVLYLIFVAITFPDFTTVTMFLLERVPFLGLKCKQIDKKAEKTKNKV
jgi:hypothetical protein